MTKQIKLTQGKVAIVDSKDYKKLNKYNWVAQFNKGNYYAVRFSPRVAGKRPIIGMHRVILGLAKGDGKEVDHINRNGLDNRRSNLRIVSHMVNCQNHSGYSHNTSGYTGVCWCKEIKKWRVYINANCKRINLGYFKNIKDATEARRQAEIKYWKGG